MHPVVALRPYLVAALAAAPLALLAGASFAAEQFARRPLQQVRDSLPVQLPRDPANPKLVIGPEPDRVIELADHETGRYRIMWRTEAGDPKELTYYSPDRVNVMIRVSVSKGSTRAYRYDYDVENLRSSGQDVFGVAIQTFGGDVSVVHPSERYVGAMARHIAEFSRGDWFRIPYEQGEIPPGGTRRVSLESNAPPGLVQVRVHGGPLVIKGIGVEPPSQLLDALPGFAAWPLGTTIGPVDNLKQEGYPFAAITPTSALDQISQAGWLIRQSEVRYRDLIRKAAWPEFSRELSRDVANGNTAAEVAYVIQRLMPKP